MTGSHRSGSTWVGKMLALSPSVGFIMEPFNVHHRPGICGARFDKWFSYVCDANGDMYEKDIRACLTFRYRLAAELKSIRSLRDLARSTRDFAFFSRNRVLNSRALQKDPIAVFSADWLATRFDMDVVVLIRHPAAFAGSLKAANWNHPFEHFLQQPLLMEQHLSDYRKEIDIQAENQSDIIGQSILLWNLIHHMISGYKRDHADWHFVRHEDLSRDPVKEYRSLYAMLGLDFSRTIERKVLQYSVASKPAALKRDSKTNISTWKDRLTAVEIDRIREGTHKLAREFYTDESWL